MRVRRPLRVDEIEAVYREHGAAFERVAVALTGDEGLGSDAVHDAFVRALRSRRSFRRDAPLVAWLWRIVVNEAHRRRPAHPVLEVPDAAGDPPSHDERSLIRARVAALPERQRLVLFLRHYADLDYAAIAAALDIKPGTVAATLHAAHDAVRRQLLEVER
jgi:RNA polymerase sigma factor (sigma-70 family)